MFSTVTALSAGWSDQPVMSLHQGSLAVRGAGDGAHRRLGHLLGAQDQARAQPRVAQPRPAELVAGPGLGVEPSARRQRRHARCGRLEEVAPSRRQRVHIHGLTRFRRRVRAVLTPAPAGLTHPNPVGRAHARPGVCGLVDERLQQPGAIAVETLEVVATARAARPKTCEARLRQQMPGRTSNRHSPSTRCRWARRRVSSQPIHVASPQTPRACCEPDPAQPAMPGAYQITQLVADKGPGAARVLMHHQRVPDPALLVGLHPHQRQVPNLADRVRHVSRRRHRVREHTRAPHTAARGPTPRQRDVACRLEVGQRRAAARALPPAASIAEIERFTDTIGDLPEAANALRYRAVQHIAQSGEVAPQAVPNLILNLHARHRSEVAS